MTFENVLIVGGTHGNERTGIALVDRWRRDETELRRPTLRCDLLLGNPGAADLNRRYLDRDLNRSFDPVDLANPQLPGYENQRARELNERFRPNGVPRYDLILDLHTSTANMGVTFITDTDPVNLKLADAARRRLPKARIYAFGPETRIHACLRVLARHAVGVEIGPVPQGVLRQDVLETTQEAVAVLLDAADAVNQTGFVDVGDGVDVFLHHGSVPYPRDSEGRIRAVIHRELEGRDYDSLQSGDPVFWDLEGGIERHDGADGLYPVFINEAAYYATGMAYSLTRRTRIAV